MRDLVRSRGLGDVYKRQARGNGITDDFLFYLRPLIGSGFEASHRLRAPKVAKLLNGNS